MLAFIYPKRAKYTQGGNNIGYINILIKMICTKKKNFCINSNAIINLFVPQEVNSQMRRPIVLIFDRDIWLSASTAVVPF